MNKISAAKKLTVFCLTAVVSSAVFASFIYFTLPEKQGAAAIPVINLENSGLGNHFMVVGVSPFGGAIANVSVPPGMPGVPTPPSVPSMPGMNVPGDIPDVGSMDTKLAVIGVLPPDVVILRKGGETVTARSGMETKLGIVGSITAKGAYVDGEFISLK